MSFTNNVFYLAYIKKINRLKLKCLNVILFKGALRINPKKYKEAFVPSPVSILFFTFTHTTFTV